MLFFFDIFVEPVSFNRRRRTAHQLGSIGTKRGTTGVAMMIPAAKRLAIAAAVVGILCSSGASAASRHYQTVGKRAANRRNNDNQKKTPMPMPTPEATKPERVTDEPTGESEFSHM